jgi:hypothetical protein
MLIRSGVRESPEEETAGSVPTASSLASAEKLGGGPRAGPLPDGDGAFCGASRSNPLLEDAAPITVDVPAEDGILGGRPNSNASPEDGFATGAASSANPLA